MSEYIGNTKKEELVQQLLEKAEFAVSAGEIDRAAAWLSEAAVNAPGDDHVGRRIFNLAQDLFYHDQPAKALILFNIIRALWERHSLAEYDYTLFDAGVCLVELGDLDQGEELLRAGIQNDPGNPWFRYTFGYFLLNQKRYEEGISVLEEAIDIDPYDDEVPDSLEAIVWALYKLGRKTEALDRLLDYLADWVDKLLPIYLRFAHLLDDYAAIEALKRLLKRMFSSEEGELDIESENIGDYLDRIFYELAERYEHLDKTEEALPYFSYLLEKQPDNPVLLGSISRAFLEMKFIEKAFQAAVRAVDLDPEDYKNYVPKAKVMMALGDYADALRAAETGLDKVSNGHIEKVAEEPASYETDQFTRPNLEGLEKEDIFSDADLKRKELYLAKADALVGLERYEDALNAIQQAESLFPAEIIFYNYAATILQKKGKPKEALEHLKKARQKSHVLDPLTTRLEKQIKATLKNMEND